MGITSSKILAKTLFIAIFISIVVISVIISSISTLKDEAIKSHLKIAQLQANTLASQVTQTIDGLEFIISNLKILLKTTKDDVLLKVQLDETLKNSPYIRSINILDEDKMVIHSSNYQNLDLTLNNNNFYPIPLFNKPILRFGNAWIGRDLVDGVEITKTDFHDNKYSSFLPLLKKIELNNKTYFILINLNTDYFINKNQKTLSNNALDFNIYRVDGILLFSSNIENIIGIKIQNPTLFNKSIALNKASGIDTQEGKKFLSAYNLTENYPLNIVVRLDYDKTLLEWEEKRENIILILSSLISFCAILLIALIYKYNLEKENELEHHKKELESKKRFQILFEQSIFLALTLKADGTISEANNLMLYFLQEEKSNIIEKKIWDLDCWNEDDKIWLRNELFNYKAETTIERVLHPLDKNLQEKIFDFKITSIEVEGNIELVALAIDITQKKEKEEKLKQAYVVFQNAHDGIIITDKDGNILNVNQSFTNSSGYTLNEVINKNPKILNSGIHEKNFYKTMWSAILLEGFWEGELINKRKDGSFYNERLSINAVYNDDKEIVNFIGIFSDITKQKEQEKNFKEQEKLLHQQSKLAAMGEMIENIAHQWRQPLSIISSAVTGMQIQKELNLPGNIEDEIKSLALINNSAQYLSKTIDDFRDFLRTDKIKAEISIKATLDKSLDLLSSRLKNRNISIIKNVENLSVIGIENELLQVFMNIINNAKDALENKKIEEKLILIDVTKEGDDVVIIIKDNAGGINEEIINRVFEPYFTTKHKSQGTGIGLYMSQEIIRNHMAGAITCYNSLYMHNTKWHKGATFKIVIPIV